MGKIETGSIHNTVSSNEQKKLKRSYQDGQLLVLL